MEIKTNELLDYFQESMRSVKKADGDMLGQRKARYPMAVVFLGKDTADRLSERVKQELFRLWPAYRNAFLFLCAEETQEQVIFTEIGGGTFADDTALQTRVSDLFQDGPYFKEYNRLVVFYILDTMGCFNEPVPGTYASLIRRTNEAICYRNQKSIFVLTLDERVGREDGAAIWRNWLNAQQFQGEGGPWKPETECTVLVSNRSSIGSTMPQPAEYFAKIMAGLMVLTDGEDSFILSTLQAPGVRTVGYAAVQKPSEDIAKVSLSELLRQMNNGFGNSESAETIPNLKERFALRAQMDSYLDAADAMLPSKEQLDMFPRRSFEDKDLYSLTAGQLDEETFGAWSAYKRSIISGMEQKILADVEAGGSFRERFLQHLKQEFTRTELLWLSGHSDQVEMLIREEANADVHGGARASFRADLGKRLLENPAVQESIKEAVQEAGEQAKEFMVLWHALLEEEFLISDKSVEGLYRQKVVEFMDTRNTEMGWEFRTLVNEEDLERFLRKWIRSLVESAPLYRETFENEVITRLGEQDPASALRQIAEKVTGEAVRDWFSTNGFKLGDPLLRLLFLKEGSDLEATIKSGLNPGMYYYYDNDSGEEASALNIYELDTYQLQVE